ncbi:uncharacterized protein TNIN_484791 [Trichonephila inaurata madagascariensis]|uniref:Uncharacterized protein n=1 Tax=Trichonephila inaurata madagascariensis TaxID=2747483 RepID=A0A8X6Y683_9ARAC|nr:uncharacterized protein TNIN_484791 [Trichonephila inaurata madagascariensis]
MIDISEKRAPRRLVPVLKQLQTNNKMASAQKWVCLLVVLVILGTFISEPVTAHHHHRQGNIVELLAAGIVAKMLSEHKHHGCHHG